MGVPHPNKNKKASPKTGEAHCTVIFSGVIRHRGINLNKDFNYKLNIQL